MSSFLYLSFKYLAGANHMEHVFLKCMTNYYNLTQENQKESIGPSRRCYSRLGSVLSESLVPCRSLEQESLLPGALCIKELQWPCTQVILTTDDDYGWDSIWSRLSTMHHFKGNFQLSPHTICVFLLPPPFQGCNIMILLLLRWVSNTWSEYMWT